MTDEDRLAGRVECPLCLADWEDACALARERQANVDNTYPAALPPRPGSQARRSLGIHYRLVHGKPALDAPLS